MSGFPNLQIIGSVSQAAIAWNYPHVMTMQAEHAVRVATFALENDVEVTEITREDEDAWLAAMAAEQDKERLQFFSECTPGYYNNEGVTTDRPPTFASAYGGGPVKYEAMLRELEARFRREAAASSPVFAS
jgi:cyclohexanone monooxygenase